MADDVKAGVKSSALLFGRQRMKLALSVFAFMSIAGWAFAGYQNGQGPAFYFVSILCPIFHFTWQITSLRIESPKDCLSKFVVRYLIGGSNTACG
jgi:4-hydroxybenzoate polyprenyltransferase